LTRRFAHNVVILCFKPYILLTRQCLLRWASSALNSCDEETEVERVVLTVPDMWADHHVLSARHALAAAPGITEVSASARDLHVTVEFDPSLTDAATIAAVLTAAGYQPGELPAAGPPQHDKPSWADGPRVTTTDADDAAMSGDYRQY
jgi:copper chaperone CopZ